MPVTRRVTATDGAGAAGAAESAGVVVSTVKILSVKTLSSGRILPRIAPPQVGLPGREAGAGMVRRVGPNAITLLGEVVRPNGRDVRVVPTPGGRTGGSADVVIR